MTTARSVSFPVRVQNERRWLSDISWRQVDTWSVICDKGCQFKSQLWNSLMTLIGTMHQNYSISSRMVECLHCQLKAALKAQLNPDTWMDTLPLIFLGIRTALKPDLNSSAAEMTYGTTLRLPGEFFQSSPTNSMPDPSQFLNQLRTHFWAIKPTSPPLPNSHSSVPHTLSTTTHVFVCHDAVTKPLQPPYDGPYPVIKRTNKHLTVNIKGKNDTISVDHLKPAHIYCERSTHPQHSDNIPSQSSTTPLTSPPLHSHLLTTHARTTRSGRHVHFPSYLSRNV